MDYVQTRFIPEMRNELILVHQLFEYTTLTGKIKIIISSQ